VTLTSDDLEAAAAEGIVTSAQAEALREFVLKRERQRAVVLGHEERFRFMRGFNDFFFAIGVVLLGFGLMFFTDHIGDTLGRLLAAAIMWGLAELLVRRMRLVLPGILIVLFFVIFLVSALHYDRWLSPPPPLPAPWGLVSIVGGLFMTGDPKIDALTALSSSAAAALFYVRFRLPFALLPIAGGLVVAAVAGSTYTPIGDSAYAQSFVLLACGLAVFAAAMAFDLSDRERMTRRADCAFWLHLLAAPLIVHSLIWMAGGIANINAATATGIVIIVGAVTLVAIIIDRRALLVSALSYLGAVIAYALAGAARDSTFVFFSTLVILGTAIITLGVGWLPLRRRLVALLTFTGLPGRLPPVVAE
jgi:hypothetical protein